MRRKQPPSWRKTLSLLLAVTLTGFYSGAARAWSAEGHRVIALIAQSHLTPAAQASVARLLAIEGFSDMAAIASWADEFRGRHRETAPWHFVNIPLEAAAYDAARDCPALNCVVTKIDQFAAVLADRTASDRKREIALKFLVHLVGDLHQPLHSTDHGDRGGNEIVVLYRGDRSNLHHVWDSELVRNVAGPDEAAFARRLDPAVGSAAIARLSAGTPVDWVNESHRQAVSFAYGGLPESPDEDLAGEYARSARPVVASQLLKAGLRLAALLNAALP